MSKAFLKDLLNDRKSENIFFPAIKQAWAEDSALKAKNHVWSKHINPSSHWFTYDGCPYNGIKEISAPRKASESHQVQNMEVGNYIHSLFQDWSQKIPDFLWDDRSVEFSFFHEKYAFSGRADLILKVNNKPVLGEIKIPQREEGFLWDSYRRILPEQTHETQAVSCAVAINELGLLSKPIEQVVLLYFNPGIPSKKVGFQECLINITEERRAKVKTLLEHSKKELDKYLAGEESYCTYPLCKEHAK